MNFIAWLDILRDELVQLAEEGYQTSDLEREVARLDQTDEKEAEQFCRNLYGELLARRLPPKMKNFRYEEPSSWQDIILGRTEEGGNEFSEESRSMIVFMAPGCLSA